MRVLTGNTLYVQKIDIEFLKYTMHTLPNSATDKINLDDYNKYDFIPFTDKNIILYLSSLDCIIDYQEIEKLTPEDIRKKGITLASEREKATSIIYQSKEGSEEYKEAMYKYKILNHLLTSLEDISDKKNGLLKITIPSENRFKRLMNTFKKKKNN